MIIHITEENKNLYDVETIKQILNVSKSKVQRELKKQQTEIIKYKNLFLYPETTLFELLEIIIIEKNRKLNDRLE
jgi:hypothetical protein